MAFNIILQTNSSEPIALDKDLTTVGNYNGTLRDESSIINPIVLIEADLASIATANYATITTFNRSYFIRDMRSIRNGLVEIYMHVDVLASFKVEIRANKGIIFRQESDWNLYLNDGVLEVYQNPIVTTKKFPTGFSGQSYVLAVAGRHNGGVVPGSGGGSSGEKSPAGLAAYAQYMLGKPYWYGTYGQTATQALLDERRSTYPSEYPDDGTFETQLGSKVFDCVGLIKGYRWSDSFTAEPVYNGSQDVNVSSLWGQCSYVRGLVGGQGWTGDYENVAGVCLFTQGFSHVGVSLGNGYAIEARGHAWGVVQTAIADRNWYWFGIPDWLNEGNQYIID